MDVNINTIIYYCTASSDPGFACDYSTRYDMLSEVCVSVREKHSGGKRGVFFVVQCRTRGSNGRPSGR